MFDIGWTEMAVIALIALLVIGPKDLPRVMRTVGQWVRKARSITREFQSGLDQMVRDAELEDARKAVQNAGRTDLKKAITDTVDPTGSIKSEVESAEAAARDNSANTSKPQAKSHPLPGGMRRPESETASSSDAPEAGDKEAPAAETSRPSDAAAAEAGATVIRHPVSMAPPHSIMPAKPAAGEAAPETVQTTASVEGAGEPKPSKSGGPEDRSSQKSA